MGSRCYRSAAPAGNFGTRKSLASGPLVALRHTVPVRIPSKQARPGQNIPRSVRKNRKTRKTIPHALFNMRIPLRRPTSGANAKTTQGGDNSSWSRVRRAAPHVVRCRLPLRRLPTRQCNPEETQMNFTTHARTTARNAQTRAPSMTACGVR
ncbi:Uncharacterized protein ToN1_16420 [Aromatoleum petrolei]|nr:Uncharacterized protein ToN1_16420 [Aromatoleum petrolei]